MNTSGHVHCEFWGERTSVELFAICCNIATTLGIYVRATDNVSNMRGGEESSFDFDIVGNCSIEQFGTLCEGIRANGIRVKEAQLGEPEEFDENYDDDNSGDEPWDGFNSDAEADADVLRSAGFGTDEDYGYFGGDEDF